MSFRFLRIAAAVAAGLWTGSTAALAENRIALVIGNSSYQSVPVLPNPANDAKAMAELLTSAGFEVISAPDLTQGNMRRTIGEFADKVAALGPDTVVIVFYAGHGLQVDGENYLVPVDARIVRESDVPLQATRLVDLMNALATVPSKARIVMLDACRNNPFSEINKVTGRGLAIVDAPRGSLVSYSTAPGTEALDGDGLNSPYTAAVLKVAKEPGLPVEQMFKRVRFAVNEATRTQTRSAGDGAGQQSSPQTILQTPWESSSLTVDFSFFPGADGSSAPMTSARTGQPAAGQQPAGRAGIPTRSIELWKRELARKPAREAYEIVIKEDTVEAYQAYLALFSAQPDARAVRTLVERRKVMVDWYVARTADTPAAYQTFLASYASSDFATAAQTLLGRAQTRSLAGGATALANVCPCSLPTPTQQLQKKTTKTKSTNRRRNDDDDEPPRRLVTTPGTPVIVSPVTTVRPSFGIGIGGGGRPSGGTSTPQTTTGKPTKGFGRF